MPRHNILSGITLQNLTDEQKRLLSKVGSAGAQLFNEQDQFEDQADRCKLSLLLLFLLMMDGSHFHQNYIQIFRRKLVNSPLSAKHMEVLLTSTGLEPELFY